jgi:ABC-type glycerol-3-phosphate transport system substrate-binding protein
MASKRWGWSIMVLLMLSVVFSACSGSTGLGATGGKVTIKLFFHSGQSSEQDALNARISQRATAKYIAALKRALIPK